MNIGDNVLKIGEGRAYEGVILDTRKIGPQTEARVRWHKGYASWVPMVELDFADAAYPLDTPTNIA